MSKHVCFVELVRLKFDGAFDYQNKKIAGIDFEIGDGKAQNFCVVVAEVGNGFGWIAFAFDFVDGVENCPQVQKKLEV